MSSPVVIAPISTPINAEIEAVIQCESGGNQFNKDGGYLRGQAGEIGLGQFMPSTWSGWNLERQKEGLEQLNIGNGEHQRQMMVWAWEQGYQRAWTCYRQIYEGYKLPRKT